jgi:hypothetical protein
MKKNSLLVFLLMLGHACFGAVPRFEKVSDHCFYLQFKDGGENVAAVITEEGILVIDPPSEPNLAATVESLKRVSTRPVLWVAFTDIRFARKAGARYFAEQGAVLLASSSFRTLSGQIPVTETSAGSGGARAADIENSYPWMVFGRQMHLFPAGLEIRIFALQNKARTGADIVVFVPAEKVLFVGSLFEAARYPDIDTASGGDALSWIDGMKQVISAVPVLKPAITQKPAPPQAKTATKPDQEKTLEEGIAVVSARGEVSNLQNIKDLLEAVQKLRNELSRGSKAGNTCDLFLVPDPYRSYGNLGPYVDLLCVGLSQELP